jgi:hypothetical protein
MTSHVHNIDKLARIVGQDIFDQMITKSDVVAVPIVSETDSSYLYQKQVNFRYLPQHDEFLSFAREQGLSIKKPEIYDKDLDKSDYQTYEIIAQFILHKTALPVLVKFVNSRITELNTDGYYKIENVSIRFYYLEEDIVVPCQYEGSVDDFEKFINDILTQIVE